MRNLLNDLRGLVTYYRQEFAHDSWTNAFLLAAGINQIVEDYLHLDPLFLRKAALVIARDAPQPIKPFSWIVRSVAFGVQQTFTHLPHFRRLYSWQEKWGELVQDLAEQAVQPNALRERNGRRLSLRSMGLLEALDGFPKQVLRSVLHIPSCFRGFDQVPDDIFHLAQKFSDAWPDRNRSLVIVGLRTSGNYLAPLCRVFLQKLGYSNTKIITFRPGSLLLPREKIFIQTAVRSDALFIVVDDPPASGHSILKSCQELERMGVPHKAIILFVALFHNREGFPRCLEPYNSIVLPWEEWEIQRKLEPESIQPVLANFFESGTQISQVERLRSLPDTVERGHVRALYKVILRNPVKNEAQEKYVFVKGVGYAYFGEHSLEVARSLSTKFPQIYGMSDGLIFREWLAEEGRLPIQAEGQERAIAKSIVDYVVTRRRNLSVPDDLSIRLLNEGPAWEVASNIISRVFGRAWWIARIPIVDPLIRWLLRISDPSLIDGNMSPSHWFVNNTDKRLLKTCFEESVFRNDIEFTCYDPVFDLASFAADLDLANVQGAIWAQNLYDLLQPLYEAVTGDNISEERWLLYQLIRLWDIQRGQTDKNISQVQRTFSRALQRYYTALYFQTISCPSAGPICAIDSDGVLETDYLGFSGLSPTSAEALRALVLHGYRPVLATGRSLVEVMDRCGVYPFAGAVAEYGAVIYNSTTGNTRCLLSQEDRETLDKLRETLQAMSGILLDSNYKFAVRASRINTKGQQIPLTSNEVDTVLEKMGQLGCIHSIQGDAQTDFMVSHVSKRVGLRILIEELQPNLLHEELLPLAMAVGDTVSDLPMLNMAKLSCVPAHAHINTKRTMIKRMSKPYQAGFALSVRQLLEHQPGRCPQCSHPNLSTDSKYLATLFSAQEIGLSSMLYSVLRLIFAQLLGNLH